MVVVYIDDETVRLKLKRYVANVDFQAYVFLFKVVYKNPLCRHFVNEQTQIQAVAAAAVGDC